MTGKHIRMNAETILIDKSFKLGRPALSRMLIRTRLVRVFTFLGDSPMKFTELTEHSKQRARDALYAILTSSCVGGEDKAKAAGEFVSSAFLAMERFNSAPDVCGDSKPCDGKEKGRDFLNKDHLDKDHDGG